MLSSPSPAIAVIAIGKIQYRRQKKDYRKQNPVFIRVQKRKNRKYHDQYTHYDMKHIQGKRDIRAFLSFFLPVSLFFCRLLVLLRLSVSPATEAQKRFENIKQFFKK